MTPFETELGGSFGIPSGIGICHSSLNPATSVSGSLHITSSRWHQAVPLSPLTLQGLDPLNAEQTAGIYQLATECQTLGSEFTKWFQTLCRLEASHHMAAKATTHKIVLSRYQACSTAYGVATATQQAKQWKLTLHRLCKEANKAWKGTSDVTFSHLLKYDSELANFPNSAEDALKNKCDEIWGHVQSLVEAMNCSPQTSLSLALQILHWLPSIPWDLSYCRGIPTMFAYGPKLYELQTWGATGDGGFHLDNNAQATNLLFHKLAHIHGGAGSPARFCSKTPSHRTSLVRSHSYSASSAGSHAAASQSPAGSGGKDHEDTKSTSQDGSGTNDESAAGSGEAPEDDKHQVGEGSNIANSSSNVKEA